MKSQLTNELMESYLAFVLKLAECKMRRVGVNISIENELLIMKTDECNCKFPINTNNKFDKFIIKPALTQLEADFKELYY